MPATQNPTITNRDDLVQAIKHATSGILATHAVEALADLGATLWDQGYHTGVMDEFKNQDGATPNPVSIVTTANNTFEDDDAEAPFVTAARAKVFRNGTCLVCGHLEGDHEHLDTDRFTCDDDCDEDLNGYCHPGRV